ncbi:hypothetical protein D3C87_1785250 [compost metagenome]
MPAIGIVRRLVCPMPLASGVPSWNCLSGRWQDAQATLPLPLRRVSKNSARPSAAAAGSSPTAFDGSGGSGGSVDSDSEAMSFVSAGLQTGDDRVNQDQPANAVAAKTPPTTNEARMDQLTGKG